MHSIDCHEASDRVVMDYVGIDIKSINYASSSSADFESVDYFLHTDLNANLGNALEIALPKGKCYFVVDRFSKKLAMLDQTS